MFASDASCFLSSTSLLLTFSLVSFLSFFLAQVAMCAMRTNIGIEAEQANILRLNCSNKRSLPLICAKPTT